MARVSWTRRLAAACAALALAWALVGPPPSRAVVEGPREAPTEEIAAAALARVGVFPSVAKRSVDAPAVARRGWFAPRPETPRDPPARTAPAGGDAPALVRWLLAHGTSTSSP